MKKLCAAVLLSAALAASLGAQEIANVERTREIAENAVRVFSDGRFQEGLDIIKPYWAASPVTLDNMAVETRRQWSVITENYGSKIGMELLETAEAGDSLVRYLHLVRFERYAVVFATTFYNGADGWIVIGFTFSDELSDLF